MVLLFCNLMLHGQRENMGFSHHVPMQEGGGFLTGTIVSKLVMVEGTTQAMVYVQCRVYDISAMGEEENNTRNLLACSPVGGNTYCAMLVIFGCLYSLPNLGFGLIDVKQYG